MVLKTKAAKSSKCMDVGGWRKLGILNSKCDAWAIRADGDRSARPAVTPYRFLISFPCGFYRGFLPWIP